MAAPFTPPEVAGWRERFPILGACSYLINNSLGAMPASVPAALAGYARLWAERGVEAWASDWLPLVDDVAGLLARLLSASPDSVVVHQNVATLTGFVFSALDFPPQRDRVVMVDAEWPGHRYLAEQHRRDGARLELVPTDGVEADTERLLAAIDERTRLLIASHVLFRSAAIQDVAAVAARCRDVGALSLIDGYHAVGHMPVDVAEIGCDFYVGGSVKWLCGGPGVGYLYMHPDQVARLRPRQVGWLGHAAPFDFADAWAPAGGAAGWLGGTPAVPALYAAREGYRAIVEADPARIRATSAVLTARLVDRALAQDLAVRTPRDPARRAGAVTLDLGDASERIGRRLVEAGIVVDHRPGAGIRAGPHFFNTIEECDQLLDAIAAAL